MASLTFNKKHAFKRKSNNKYLVITVIIIIAAVLLVLLSLGGVNTISQSETVTLKQGTAMQFYLPSYHNVFSILATQGSSLYTYIQISQSPVLASAIISFSISQGSMLNVSTTGSKNANLQVKLLSSNSTYSTIQLTPVPYGLIIPISSGVSATEPAPVPQSGSSNVSIISTTVQSTTTTQNTQQTTTQAVTTSITSVVTTTQTSNAGIPQSVINQASQSYIGSLVSNLNTLYAEESQCTQSLYNQTLISYAHVSPTGPLSYQNVTLYTPSSITNKITGPFSKGYLVTYYSQSKSSQTTGAAISMYLNQSTGAISDIVFSGIFQGQNYSDLESSYNFQSGIGNACAAYITG
ncbi:MAG: hypothetical protein ACP5M9_03235 [Candidatus Micrarchaeia archaeon]